MGNHSSEVKAKEHEFWRSYAAVLDSRGIAPNRHRWYVNWATQFAKSQKGVSLRKRTLADVTTFLDH